MMRSWVFAGLVGAGSVVVALSGICAAERQIKVINTSSSIITELYVSKPDIDDYGTNLLAGARIQSGASSTVTFGDGDACVFDFQAVTGDEDMFTARGVDVCAAPDLKLPQ